MSLDARNISAYDMYKRKMMDQPLPRPKKTKQQHLSQNNVMSGQNPVAIQSLKKAEKQRTAKKSEGKNKHTFNVSMKIRKSPVIKNVKSMKHKKRNKKENVWQNGNETPLVKNIEKQQGSLTSSDKVSGEKVITNHHDFNPIKDSKDTFEWLICPVKVQDFVRNNFEKRPLYIKRRHTSYYSNLVSTPLLDKILREKNIFYTKNIDITSYVNGVRETHNIPGRAVASAVWEQYRNKCSVRMLNPQTFIPEIYILCATLQEYFGCFVGANLYLTPPDSQGFAPHYDDIEAFVLQVEGKKRWRLYKPSDKDYLARYSSKNLDMSEVGELILDKTLEAGDLLYFPRGTIHQAEAPDDVHSLHITLSAYQKNSWGDFLEKLLPLALKHATEVDCHFREGLPMDYLRYIGTSHTKGNKEVRAIFKKKVQTLLDQLMRYINVDSAADLMAKSHVHDFLPPALTYEEHKCSVDHDGDIMTHNGVVEQCTMIGPDTRIRLIRSHCMRLVKDDDDAYRIYYSTENSKEYHEYELHFLDIDEHLVPAVRKLIRRYPRFVRVKDLPINDESKVQLAEELWEVGVVITDIPRRNLTRNKNKSKLKK